MPAKIKINLNLKSTIERAKKTAAKGLCKIYEKQVIGDIVRGVSPVKGKRFPKYSNSYKEAIRAGRYSEWGKSIAPINLKLSGVMLESFFCKTVPKGILMGFKDDVAEYHNDLGAGKSKTIRRLLPTKSGESFNSNIELAVQRYLERLGEL